METPKELTQPTAAQRHNIQLLTDNGGKRDAAWKKVLGYTPKQLVEFEKKKATEAKKAAEKAAKEGNKPAKVDPLVPPTPPQRNAIKNLEESGVKRTDAWKQIVGFTAQQHAAALAGQEKKIADAELEDAKASQEETVAAAKKKVDDASAKVKKATTATKKGSTKNTDGEDWE